MVMLNYPFSLLETQGKLVFFLWNGSLTFTGRLIYRQIPLAIPATGVSQRLGIRSLELPPWPAVIFQNSLVLVIRLSRPRVCIQQGEGVLAKHV